MLGGITVVLYGMIGLLGAKIWKENRVDFANPINLVPSAAGIIIGIGNVPLKFTDDFALSGIALGTIVTIAGYHLARAIAPADLQGATALHRRAVRRATAIAVDGGTRAARRPWTASGRRRRTRPAARRRRRLGREIGDRSAEDRR